MVVRIDELMQRRSAGPKFVSRKQRKDTSGRVHKATRTAGFLGAGVKQSMKDIVVDSESEHDLRLPSWRLLREKELSTEIGSALQETAAPDVPARWATKPTSEMTDRDWRIMSQELGIAYSSSTAMRPLRLWSELDSETVTAVSRLGYNEPTPIQRGAIPLALAGHDVIGIAETGSGKTASFAIPLINLLRGNSQSKIAALVLAPTRELALQIHTETNKLMYNQGLRSAALVGGRSLEEQADVLARGVDIVVATPGRLVDFLNQNLIVLGNCYHLVLDEADRMVDMGFEEQLRQILAQLPAERQTMMYTATWPPAVSILSEQYLRNPQTVTISKGSVNTRVHQIVELLEPTKRLARLLSVLKSHGRPVIVFANQKGTVDHLLEELIARGINAVSIHGNKSQEQRERVLQDLRAGRADILVATDVAGRGIDIPDVSLVVNFEFPRTVEAYVHRIGRTGRAGQSGNALTFVGDADRALFAELRAIVRRGGSPVPSFLVASID